MIWLQLVLPLKSNKNHRYLLHCTTSHFLASYQSGYLNIRISWYWRTSRRWEDDQCTHITDNLTIFYRLLPFKHSVDRNTISHSTVTTLVALSVLILRAIRWTPRYTQSSSPKSFTTIRLESMGWTGSIISVPYLPYDDRNNRMASRPLPYLPKNRSNAHKHSQLQVKMDTVIICFVRWSSNTTVWKAPASGSILAWNSAGNRQLA